MWDFDGGCPPEQSTVVGFAADTASHALLGGDLISILEWRTDVVVPGVGATRVEEHVDSVDLRIVEPTDSSFLDEGDLAHYLRSSGCPQ